MTCWWLWGWKEKHRRPLQGHSGTRCHPIPHMRLTTVWVPGGPGSCRGHQGGLGARRKARRESCVPGRVLPPAPGFAPRFRLEPCGRGAGAEPNPKNSPQGTPRDKASPANPPQPTGQLLHTHLGGAALLPALPLAHLQHLKGAQESPGLISTQGNELGSPAGVRGYPRCSQDPRRWRAGKSQLSPNTFFMAVDTAEARNSSSVTQRDGEEARSRVTSPSRGREYTT